MKLDVNVLVNKDNPLDLNYIPDNLYIVDDNKDNFHNYKDPNLKPMLRKDIKNYIDMLLMDAKKLGFPKDNDLTVQDIVINQGAGFITILLGKIVTMPGLPKNPNYEKIDVVDNQIIGIF